MAFFFPRTVYHTTPAPAPIHPLFSLLSELQQPRPQHCQRQRHHYRQQQQPSYRVSVRPWEPRFETAETDDAFVLYGELPGLNKDNISVEFPEARKLVVSGRVERSSPVAKPETQQAAPAQTTETDTETIAEDTRSQRSYQATVEDDEDDFEVLSHTSEKSHTSEESHVSEKVLEKQPEQPAQPTTEAPEDLRSGYVKEFSRYFTFPSDVDHDFVTADLKDGLLTIMVPKAKKPEPRRIVIN